MILYLIKRNLKLYFRDKMSVFFSMLGVFIIIMLYLVFLGDLMADAYQFPDNMGIDGKFFVNSWIMAGVVSAATVTTTLGAYGVVVNDRATKVLNDFKVSPIKRSQLVLSYVLSSLAIGFIMSCVSLAFAEGYILISGGEFLGIVLLLKTLGIVLLSVLMSSAIIFLIIAFVKSNNAFGAISTVFGSIIGFLMGVYVPIGNLGTVATIIKLFPFAHPAVLLRQVMMEQAVGDLSYVPTEDLQFLGVQFAYGDYVMPFSVHLLLMMIVTVVFFGLGVMAFSKKKDSF